MKTIPAKILAVWLGISLLVFSVQLACTHFQVTCVITPKTDSKVLLNKLRRSSVSVGGFCSGNLIHLKEGSGIVLLCAHCFKNDVTEGIDITLYNGTTHKGSLMAVDRTKDLAIVRVRIKAEDKMVVLKIADSPPELYDKLYMVGHPSNIQYTPSVGFYTGIEHLPINIMPPRSIRVYKFGMNAFFGNSGSAITNSKGEIVSVLTRVHVRYHYSSFGVPLSDIKDFLKTNQSIIYE